MRKLDPAIHDERDVEWKNVWTALYPYYAIDLATYGSIDSLDPYLVQAVEEDDDRECQALLLFLDIVSLKSLMRRSQETVDEHSPELQRDILPINSSEHQATQRMIEILENIYNGMEPNKAFRWTKNSRGKYKDRKFEKFFMVAVPEEQRLAKVRTIKARLKEPDVKRRERVELTTELAELGPVEYEKINISKNGNESAEYSLRSLQVIMKEYGESAQQLLESKKNLEEYLQKCK